MQGLYSHSRENRKIVLRNKSRAFAKSLWNSCLCETHPHECRKIPGELFMYWFRARLISEICNFQCPEYGRTGLHVWLSGGEFISEKLAVKLHKHPHENKLSSSFRAHSHLFSGCKVWSGKCLSHSRIAAATLTPSPAPL